MSFKKIAKVVFISISLLICTLHVQALGTSTESFDWNPLMDAITKVESSGNRKAVNGQSCGPMQITPSMVKECNNILKDKGEKKRYTLGDRYSVRKSREMFVLFMSKYNPKHNVELAIRMWNGGLHYTARRTNHYYRKVMAVYTA